MWIFGENESPLGGQAGKIVQCNANVAARLRHGVDADEDEQITRVEYDERVECE